MSLSDFIVYSTWAAACSIFVTVAIVLGYFFEDYRSFCYLAAALAVALSIRAYGTIYARIYIHLWYSVLGWFPLLLLPVKMAVYFALIIASFAPPIASLLSFALPEKDTSSFWIREDVQRSFLYIFSDVQPKEIAHNAMRSQRDVERNL